MSTRVNYSTLIFPPPRSPGYEAQTPCYNAGTNSNKEEIHELPFERTLIALNSKEYEFTDSELDLYCDGGSSSSSSSSSSSNSSSHHIHGDVEEPTSPVEGDNVHYLGRILMLYIVQKNKLIG